MRTRPVRAPLPLGASLAALAALAALAGCDPSAIGAAGDLRESPARQSSRSVAGYTAGGGKAQLPPGFSLLSFAFNAKQHEDGSASGRFQYEYESAGGVVSFRGEVTCVAFDPLNHRAWIGGIVTANESTHPAMQGEIHQPGRDVWFRVVDYGEGADAPNDRTTVLGFEGAAGVITSAEYCERRLWAAGDANTWAVVRGNIQVGGL